MSEKQRVWDVIPKTAKIIGIVATVGCGLVLRFAALATDPEMASWEGWQKNLLSFTIALVAFFYILLIGYVYGDAKRRYMRYAMWTWIAALMPYAIGAIIYFAIRDPLPPSCPSCQTPARPGFAYCTKCGAPLKRSCEGCARMTEPDWVNCAYCGKKLGSGTPTNS
ncbi:MAG TPA: zinc ribbon domain-containing protein [Candidatus Acidoferrales bacterium]|nr:zinc ribbon domain-containing protein [Candidatus Acidoferrales bacterium]